ncbi:hypothetical protein V6N11_080550 [Hibiscus sabdariffa]|uniref:Endonuclease/exonuclease/phosphatase domain-containing protein n=1 Tax=Hibiscus sabdariffa TaxID=183260 RepID=A0ABR2R7Y4_9ROSI
MAVMAWNVRGLGQQETVRALKNMIFKFKPRVVFLSETKQKKRYLEKIRMKMKMHNSFYVEPIGKAGGLALWWTNDTSVNVLNHGRNLIDTRLSINGEEEWFGTFIYGPPYDAEKQHFWESLINLLSNMHEKWCIMGDSNIVARADEKVGGAPFDFSRAKWFYDVINKCGLLEIPTKGGTFTWSNQRSQEDAILEKLDRVLSSLEWNKLFPKALACLDVAIASDHAPIILLLQGLNKKGRRDFKFESKWLLEEECAREVTEGWKPVQYADSNNMFGRKMKRTRLKLSKWSKVKYGKNKKVADELINKIKALEGKPLSFTEAKEVKELKKELDKTDQHDM